MSGYAKGTFFPRRSGRARTNFIMKIQKISFDLKYCFINLLAAVFSIIEGIYLLLNLYNLPTNHYKLYSL
jgi:hypothetical protein